MAHFNRKEPRQLSWQAWLFGGFLVVCGSFSHLFVRHDPGQLCSRMPPMPATIAGVIKDEWVFQNSWERSLSQVQEVTSTGTPLTLRTAAHDVNPTNHVLSSQGLTRETPTPRSRSSASDGFLVGIGPSVGFDFGDARTLEMWSTETCSALPRLAESGGTPRQAVDPPMVAPAVERTWTRARECASGVGELVARILSESLQPQLRGRNAKSLQFRPHVGNEQFLFLGELEDGGVAHISASRLKKMVNEDQFASAITAEGIGGIPGRHSVTRRFSLLGIRHGWSSDVVDALLGLVETCHKIHDCPGNRESDFSLHEVMSTQLESLDKTGFFESDLVRIRSKIRRNFSGNGSLGNLQAYSPELAGLGLRLSASYEFQTGATSIGLGKALFYPLGADNFGVISGLDVGIGVTLPPNVRLPSTSVFRRVQGRAFLGVGLKY